NRKNDLGGGEGPRVLNRPVSFPANRDCVNKGAPFLFRRPLAPLLRPFGGLAFPGPLASARQKKRGDNRWLRKKTEGRYNLPISSLSANAREVTMRRIVIVLITLISIAILLAIFLPPFLFQPDGINLLKNGGFEMGKAFDPDPDETFVTGPNVRILCDRSTSIDDWVATGPGPSGIHEPCSGGRPRDVLEYVANDNCC